MVDCTLSVTKLRVIQWCDCALRSWAALFIDILRFPRITLNTILPEATAQFCAVAW
jgi:hypothetical protein